MHTQVLLQMHWKKPKEVFLKTVPPPTLDNSSIFTL